MLRDRPMDLDAYLDRIGYAGATVVELKEAS
jgi:hypothetical protein